MLGLKGPCNHGTGAKGETVSLGEVMSSLSLEAFSL